MKLALIVKRDCETCQLVDPLIGELMNDHDLMVYSQDDPEFPNSIAVHDDRTLEKSWQWRIEVVPTLMSFDETGQETNRLEGWEKSAWEELTGINFADDLF